MSQQLPKDVEGLVHALDQAIVAPETYAHPDHYDALFRTLRQDDPVHWTAPSGFHPFWTVSKYEDVQYVESKSNIFLNAPRLILRSIQDEEKVKAQTGGRPFLMRNLVNMDAPDHHIYRRLTHTWFSPVRLKALENDLHGLAREFVDRMLEKGEMCDFASDIAVWYPLRVIMRILGVPQSDEARMLKLTQEIFGAEDPEMRRTQATSDVMATVGELFDYFRALTADRRRKPTDDVASVIANAEINGQPIGDLEALSYYIIVATAGHDTTSSTTAGGLLALAQNPEEMAKLRQDPSLLPSAIDEMIRWVSPVKHFFRTADEDHELRGNKIRAGDSLMMCYPSANRDEDVFEAPFEFRIERSPNRHIAFGYGPHLCLGQHLARMEIRIFFEELLPRLSDITLAGEPKWIASNFVSGLKHFPIRYRAA